MNYYVIEYLGGDRGCPDYLKGTLNKDFQWEAYDPDVDKFVIDAEYEFRAKHTAIDLDFWDGLLCSENFTALCREFGLEMRLIPVKIIQSNKIETQKKYFYVLVKDYLSILDVEQSNFRIDLDMETSQPVYDRFFPDQVRYEAIYKFIVDSKKVGSAGIFKCLDIGAKFVCNQLFKDACNNRKLLGLKFTPIDESFQVIPFWLKDE
ncbi:MULTISPECIES: DUF1629 domain-containing protein [unclassified Undibacterium]|uniref:imm11 family protein n=1 Tax=unclassified Undibacterium TaxID=2630295 RepID=UPI003399F85C